MKRKQTIVAADNDVTVRVTVEVVSKKHGLTRDETNILLTRIVDESMLTIKAAPYIYASLSGMKVT
jgi:hypothetical protein